MDDHIVLDPIGTVRQENHHDGGSSIWVRQDPGYPDNQFGSTEWTCIHSIAPGNIGARMGAHQIELPQHPVIGQVPGTPAETGEDVEVGDRVRLLDVSGSGPLTGTVDVKNPPRAHDLNPRTHTFRIALDHPVEVPGFSEPVRSWGASRWHFGRIVTDEELDR